MRFPIAFMALAAQMTASAVMAAQVNVDFSTLGATPQSITHPDSVTLGDVTMTYDVSSGGTSGGYATVNSSGIAGGTIADLNLTFSTPITQLAVTWTVEGVASDPTGNDALQFNRLDPAGEPLTVVGTYDAGNQRVSGQLNYLGSAITVGELLFDPTDFNGDGWQSTTFTVTAMSYTPIPEPAVIGIGLAASTGLLVRRRAQRTSR